VTAQNNRKEFVSINSLDGVRDELSTVDYNTLMDAIWQLPEDQRFKAAVEIDSFKPDFLGCFQLYYLIRSTASVQKKTRDPFGKVYFAQEEQSGNIKIGFTTKTPEKRINQFRGMNHGRIVLLMSVQAPRSFETQLHQLFAPFRLNGEWFSGSVVIQAIPSLSTPDAATQDYADIYTAAKALLGSTPTNLLTTKPEELVTTGEG
jgi:hypothetical protein